MNRGEALDHASALWMMEALLIMDVMSCSSSPSSCSFWLFSSFVAVSLSFSAAVADDCFVSIFFVLALDDDDDRTT